MTNRANSVTANPVATLAAVDQFWAWWRTSHDAIARSIVESEPQTYAEEISRQVAAIHPELQWELGGGVDAQHALTVTAAGVFAHRGIAERWFRSAPEADDTWEYYPSRQRDGRIHSAALEIRGHRIALGDLTCDVTPNPQQAVFDIVVSHPAFAALPENARAEITFLALDWLLGEDGVEEWVGSIEHAASPGPDWHPLSSLQAAVDQLVEAGVPQNWAQLNGQAPDGSPIAVSVLRPLKRAHHPLFDLHTTIEVEFSDRTPAGLPGPVALEQLRAFEDQLIQLCGPHALLVAHASHSGLRSFDVYTDHTTDVADQIGAWVSRTWPASSTQSEIDPAWDAVGAFR